MLYRAAYDTDSHALISKQSLEMLCLTWNVNEQRPDPSSSLFQWVADLSAKASLVVVALQEIEMGGSSVAIAAAKDVLNKSAQVCDCSAALLLGLHSSCLADHTVPCQPVVTMSMLQSDCSSAI